VNECFLEGTTFQRKKAASAAKIRPVLPAAVMRSAPLPEDVVFVPESVGFRLPALSVDEGLEPDAVTAFVGAVVVFVVVLDWVMANCCD
jgi:hypothetical protein